MRALIAYFSRADENYFSGELRTIPVGNTEVAAKLLQRLTGADLFQLEPLLPLLQGLQRVHRPGPG